ncbi:nucleotidyltransferase domain-containing protein [Flavisphingomonas formosensis]|uniref:nucleotidyltransferase domain-containing protein n=1 Tax=Flavisphingomonas formosensis TaxID=861534 RepID=UPI0012F9F843|nr:nucleotidyltransferase family protein [Sphingomonas formosensis]
MKEAALLVRLLADPAEARAVPPAAWTGLLAAARAEQLIGTLACRLDGLDLPDPVLALLRDARAGAAQARMSALWEAEMARRALEGLRIPVILLKGTAFVAAGLSAGIGRSIGDLDILVNRADLPAVEAALIAAGWEWVKEDAYDDLYYRQWMHELPPLIHRTRDRMIDVHHTILPPTARPTPDAAALVADSVTLENGLRMLCPEDMIVHAVAHLFADGDLAGGLRNLWDIDRLLRDFSAEDGFWERLEARGRLHQLGKPLARALRLAERLYGTRVDPDLAGPARVSDALYVRRLLVRDGWGRQRRPVTRFAFYIRSHWLRMSPLMLARHLWIKARKG